MGDWRVAERGWHGMARCGGAAGVAQGWGVGGWSEVVFPKAGWALCSPEGVFAVFSPEGMWVGGVIFISRNSRFPLQLVLSHRRGGEGRGHFHPRGGWLPTNSYVW